MTPQEMVLEFHRVFNCSVDDRSADNLESRMTLLDEEMGEFFEEMYSWYDDDMDFGILRTDIDWEAVAKEMADLLYILYGNAVAWGIDLDETFRRVHESNMNKLWEDGKPRYRESDGKVLKPPTYQKPDLKGVVKDL